MTEKVDHIKKCPFCGVKMYKGIGDNKSLLKHPLIVCALTDDGKDLWFDTKLWNTRSGLTRSERKI